MKRLVVLAAVGFALGVLLALAPGCIPEPDVGEPLAGGCEPVDSDPEADVSFGADIRPLLDRPRGEAGCSCHTPGGSGQQLGGFNIASLETIRQGGLYTGARIIVPGDPCQSLLVHKVSEAPPVGARMPLDGPPHLSAEERQLIHDWIAEGALDN